MDQFVFWRYAESIWKSLCCSNRQRAYDSALFFKKYLFCARDIFIPATPQEFDPILPFFIEGEMVSAEIYSQYSVEMEDTHYIYKFEWDKTLINSLNKEDTYQFAICCGCRLIDPEDNFAPLNSRSVARKTIPRKEDDPHHYILALEKVAEIDSQRPVGYFRVHTWRQGAPEEEPLIAERMKDALKLVKFKVPFLDLTIACEGYRSWVELAEFKHLSMRTTETVEITEKMLNCGYLSVTAPISNPAELKKFKGFSLVIGLMSENGFNWDRILEEVKLWKNGTPSPLQCFGLFDHTNIPSLDDFWNRLEPYSPTGKINDPYKRIEVILLDDENDAAILFVHEHGICFVRGGWEKWKDVFLATGQSTNHASMNIF